MTTEATTSLGGAVAPLTLVTEDGFPLAATRFRALAPMRGVVVIAPAVGTRMAGYAPLAEFLASRGFEVLTWDWRGIGDSRHEAGPMDRRLTMRACGECDLTTAIGWALRRGDGVPVSVLGHAFGGHALGLAANASSIARAVLVGASEPWIGHWPWPARAPWRLVCHVAVPLLASGLDRFPASWFGLDEDLPAGVAREWARWARRRGSFASWEGHARLTIPMLAYSFSDDLRAPRAAVDALLVRYASATTTHRHFTPDALGRTEVGHFGFFQPGVAPTLWDEVATFLGEGNAP